MLSEFSFAFPANGWGAHLIDEDGPRMDAQKTTTT
jgi:hypothetical protein